MMILKRSFVSLLIAVIAYFGARHIALQRICRGISQSDKVVFYNCRADSKEVRVDVRLRTKLLKCFEEYEAFSLFNFTKMACVGDLEFFDAATNSCLRIQIFSHRCLSVDDHKVVLSEDIVDLCGFEREAKIDER